MLALLFFFLMILRPPRSTQLTHSFPTRRSSDLFARLPQALIEHQRRLPLLLSSRNTQPQRGLAQHLTLTSRGPVSRSPADHSTGPSTPAMPGAGGADQAKPSAPRSERKSVVWGTSVSVRVERGVRSNITNQ